jgi:hypothetical protein
MVIKRVEPLSCAKIAGVLYAALGTVFGVLFALGSLTGFFFLSDTFGSAGLRTIVAICAVFIVPALYGLLAFVVALIAASLYNLAAGRVGGVELHIQ